VGRSETALTLQCGLGVRLCLERRVARRRAWLDCGAIRQQARDLLVPTCGWFSAGFDTLDLKQTKALLDESTERGRLWSKRLSVQGVPSMKAELSRVVVTEPSHAWEIRFWQTIAKAFRAAKRAALIGHLAPTDPPVGLLQQYRHNGRLRGGPDRTAELAQTEVWIRRSVQCLNRPWRGRCQSSDIARPSGFPSMAPVPIHPGIDEMRQMWKLVRVGDATLKADCDGYQKTLIIAAGSTAERK
jgi:hypothetical protein